MEIINVINSDPCTIRPISEMVILEEVNKYFNEHPDSSLAQYVEYLSNKPNREREQMADRLRKAKQYNEEHYVGKYFICIDPINESDRQSGLSYPLIYIIDKVTPEIFKYEDNHYFSTIRINNWRIQVDYVGDKWGRRSSYIHCPWDCMSNVFYNPEFGEDNQKRYELIEISENDFKELTSSLESIYWNNKSTIDNIIEKYDRNILSS